jgi:hypothetical protein
VKAALDRLLNKHKVAPNEEVTRIRAAIALVETSLSEATEQDNASTLAMPKIVSIENREVSSSDDGGDRYAFKPSLLSADAKCFRTALVLKSKRPW